MRLTRLDTFHNEFVCFVKATAQDGAIGWGQCSTYNADITAAVFHRQIGPWALGQDARDIDTLVARNSGGDAGYAKIVAARALGLPAVIIRRPVLPGAETVDTVDAAVAWIDHAFPPASERGV